MKQIYRHGDNAYMILRQVNISHFSKRLDEEPNMEYVKMYMEWLGADHVLRNEMYFMFCETIKDAEYVEIDTPSDTERLDN
jgi:histone deacetylase complex regulatory component SIN3